MKNLLTHFILDEPAGFQWMNMPTECSTVGDDLCVVPLPHSDFYCAPDDSRTTLNAVFLYTRIGGDFIARVHVRPDFSDKWNAAGIMAYADDDTWVKLCFERTDNGSTVIVSVVTRGGLSDDANGIKVDQASAWLQVSRSGHIFALHQSTDGETFDLVRHFYLKAEFMLSVGLLAQCPTAESARHHFDFMGLSEHTPADLRSGW